MAISDLLRGVTPSNGYQMDLSDTADGDKRVIRGRMFIGDDDPDVIVSILEPPTAVEPIHNRAVDNQARASEWDLMVQGWAKDDRDNDPCDKAYVLAADVQAALSQELKRTKTGRPSSAPDLFQMGGLVYEMKIGTPVVRPTEAVTGYGVFYLILTLKIVEDTANPLG